MGGSNAQILCYLGLNELSAGSTEEGSRYLLESMKLDRSVPETLDGLAKGLRALGDPGGAATAQAMKEKAQHIRSRLFKLRSSPTRFEDKGEGLLEIAQAYQELGSTADAVRYYRLARAASPDLSAPYRALAELAIAPGECFFRANSLLQLVRLQPKDEFAARNLALFYAQLGVKLEKGLELARISLEQRDSPEGRYTLGEILFQLGKVEAASQEVKLALQASPEDSRLLDLASRVAQYKNSQENSN
jgi:tetratricopeptide (TPR) repeat protein